MTMAGKRKDLRKPQKLADFVSWQTHGGRQDGAGRSSTPAHSTHSTPDNSASVSKNSGSPDSQQSYSNTPQSASPAKAKFRMDGSGCSPTASPSTDSGEDTGELPDSIEVFPMNNQPVMDTVLKDMLLSLRSSIQTNMTSCMQKFNNEIQAVESRVGYTENKMGELDTVNNLVDAHDEKE